MTVALDIDPPTSGRASAAGSRLRLRNKHVVAAGTLLLLLPDALFAAALRTVPAAVLLVGVIGAAALALVPRAHPDDGLLAQPIAVSRLAVCLALGLALLALGGEAHLVFTNWDWLWRDAVLADVARAPFPPVYAVGGEHLFLRAPLGMYMLPALVARLAGLTAGHVALLVQNATFLGLILYLLATLAGRRAAVAVFVGFSGLDAVGQWIVWLWRGQGSFALPSHIESWMPGLQYSSTVTQLFWVPNHALPSYWLALLVLCCARGEASLVQLGMAMAAALFWSPFAFIGTLPFAAFLLATTWRDTLRSPGSWIAAAAALCFLPVALYLRVDAAEVPHSFLLLQPFMAVMILLFLAVEIPHVWLVRVRWRDLDPALARTAAVAAAVLVALPTMRVGLANDLAMRASIPALTILAFAFAEALAGSLRAHRGLFIGGTAIVLIGAITPAQEVARALLFPPFRPSACNLVTVWKKLDPGQRILANYLAPTADLPSALMRVSSTAVLRDDPSRTCWPDLAQTSMSRWSDTPNAALARASADAPRL